MKAEHRKELHTNVLADRMGRLVEGMKSGPRSTTAVVWVIALVAIVTLGAWWVASGTESSRSRAWVQLASGHDRDVEQRPEDLRKLAADNPGTLVARMGRFQRARLLLQQLGLELLTSESRAAAIENIEEARGLFRELARECSDDAMLTREALLKTALAEEALVGVPKADNAEESRGDLDRALDYYRKYLAQADPESGLAKTTAQHVEDLEQNRAEVLDFYKDLNRAAETQDKKAGTMGVRPPQPQ